jgi:hypothetical protein
MPPRNARNPGGVAAPYAMSATRKRRWGEPSALENISGCQRRRSSAIRAAEGTFAPCCGKKPLARSWSSVANEGGVTAGAAFSPSPPFAMGGNSGGAPPQLNVLMSTRCFRSPRVRSPKWRTSRSRKSFSPNQPESSSQLSIWPVGFEFVNVPGSCQKSSSSPESTASRGFSCLARSRELTAPEEQPAKSWTSSPLKKEGSCSHKRRSQRALVSP